MEASKTICDYIEVNYEKLWLSYWFLLKIFSFSFYLHCWNSGRLRISPTFGTKTYIIGQVWKIPDVWQPYARVLSWEVYPSRCAAPSHHPPFRALCSAPQPCSTPFCPARGRVFIYFISAQLHLHCFDWCWVEILSPVIGQFTVRSSPLRLAPRQWKHTLRLRPWTLTLPPLK